MSVKSYVIVFILSKNMSIKTVCHCVILSKNVLQHDQLLCYSVFNTPYEVLCLTRSELKQHPQLLAGAAQLTDIKLKPKLFLDYFQGLVSLSILHYLYEIDATCTTDSNVNNLSLYCIKLIAL